MRKETYDVYVRHVRVNLPVGIFVGDSEGHNEGHNVGALLGVEEGDTVGAILGEAARKVNMSPSWTTVNDV